MGVQERKAREFARRQKDILSAARTLLGDEDWLMVTIEQIADRAEVGKGTVYKHFQSKDEIYAQLALDHNRRFMQRMDELDSGLGVVDWLKALGRLTWNFALENNDCHTWLEYSERAHFRARLSEELRATFALQEAKWAVPLREKLEQGIAEGIFPTQPVEFMIISARASLFGSLQLLRRLFGAENTAGFPHEQYVEYLLDMIMNGWKGQNAP